MVRIWTGKNEMVALNGLRGTDSYGKFSLFVCIISSEFWHIHKILNGGSYFITLHCTSSKL